MKKGAKLSVNVINVKKASKFKGKLGRNYLKRIKPKKNNVLNVKSELKNWMRRVECVRVVKRSMNNRCFAYCFPRIIV